MSSWKKDPSLFTRTDRAASFDKASDADRIKQQKERERRFKTPEARADALDADADRDALLDDAKNKHNARVTELFEATDFKLWSPEYGQHYKEKLQEYQRTLKQAEDEIHDLHKAAYAEIEAGQYSTQIGPIGAERQITYRPGEQERSETAQQWERAASDHELQQMREAEATRLAARSDTVKTFERTAQGRTGADDRGLSI